MDSVHISMLFYPHFAISNKLWSTSFISVKFCLPGLEEKKKKLDVCCETLSGIPQANPPLLLSWIFEAHSTAFGVVVVCVLQL